MLDLIRKDMLLFLKDRGAIFVTFILPIALVLVLCMIYGSALDYSSPSVKVSALVVDEDKTTASMDFTRSLHANPKLELKSVDLEKARSFVKSGEYPVLIRVGKGFADSMAMSGMLPMELEVDAARTAEVATVQGVLTKESLVYKVYELSQLVDFGLESSQELADLSQAYEGAIGSEQFEVGTVETRSIVGGNGNELATVQAVAGTAVMMLLFSIIGFGGSMIEEQENGTFVRLRTSPVSLYALIGSKLLSGSLILILQMVILIGFSVAFLGLSVMGNLAPLVLLVMVTAFCVASLGMFLAAVSSTRKQLQGMGTLVIVLMSALGGSMIPLFMMPEEMQMFSLMSVNYWAIQSFYDLLWFDAGMYPFMQKAGVLVVSGLVMLLVSFHITKRKLSSRPKMA